MKLLILFVDVCFLEYCLSDLAEFLSYFDQFCYLFVRLGVKTPGGERITLSQGSHICQELMHDS